MFWFDCNLEKSRERMLDYIEGKSETSSLRSHG